GEEPGSEDPDDEEPGEEPTDEKPADEEEPKDGDQNNNPGNNNGGKSDTNKPLPQTGSPIDTLVLTLIGALTMVAGGFVLFKRKRNLAK
ncbi:MAG: LPXTG cell wall anchor domain-containing protein, partial [Clostridiales bacterium]|nr:LPXTG cell wall anchor domain-containing protein [Clostridiales bacterium]